MIKTFNVFFRIYFIFTEYFWRPWIPGSPPSDAIIGKDYRGISYIVQAYIQNYGLYVGQAFASQTHLNATIYINKTLTLTKSGDNLKVNLL